LLTYDVFSWFSNISQGSAATHLKCGGKLDVVVANFFLSLPVKYFFDNRSQFGKDIITKSKWLHMEQGVDGFEGKV